MYSPAGRPLRPNRLGRRRQGSDSRDLIAHELVFTVKEKDGRVDLEMNNVFCEPEEDARRRDFTINALFYDLDRHETIAHVGGLIDV